jgi:ribosome biogenesis protein ENP2
MHAASIGGVKIYNLSQEKFIPNSHISSSSSNSNYNSNNKKTIDRSIHLIQDFEFPAYSTRLRISDDGQTIMAVGGYPPQVRVFDVSQVSMKFERHVDDEIVDLRILSEDFSKFCILGEKRTLSFHSRQGVRHTLRVPQPGRDLCYDKETCDLYVAVAGSEVYRLNLSDGTFKTAWETGCENGINALDQSNGHRLIAGAGDDDIVRMWDPRSKKQVGQVQIPSATSSNLIYSITKVTITKQQRCTSICFEPSTTGLTLLVGTSHAQVVGYDIRSSRPLLVKTHPYGLPVTSIAFKQYDSYEQQSSERIVLTCDAKQIKAWDINNPLPNIFNIEAPANNSSTNMNDSTSSFKQICIAPVSKKSSSSSGLILATMDQPQIGTYFCPTRLGPAPKWANTLENLTEELEEDNVTSTTTQQNNNNNASSVFDDYRFVTRAVIEDMNLSHLLGNSSMLRPWMHGFLIDAKLFAELAAASNPNEYEEWKKKQAKAKRAARDAEKIVLKGPQGKSSSTSNKKVLPVLVNAELAATHESLVQDDRFKNLFENPEFTIDEQSREFKHMFPSGRKKMLGKNDEVVKKNDDDEQLVEDDLENDDGEEELEEEEEEEFEDDDDDDGNEFNIEQPSSKLSNTTNNNNKIIPSVMIAQPVGKSFIDMDDQNDDDEPSSNINNPDLPLSLRTSLLNSSKLRTAKESNKKQDDDDDVIVELPDGSLSITFNPATSNKKRSTSNTNNNPSNHHSKKKQKKQR